MMPLAPAHRGTSFGMVFTLAVRFAQYESRIKVIHLVCRLFSTSTIRSPLRSSAFRGLGHRCSAPGRSTSLSGSMIQPHHFIKIRKAHLRDQEVAPPALHPLHGGHVLPRAGSAGHVLYPAGVVPAGPLVLHHQNVRECVWYIRILIW